MRFPSCLFYFIYFFISFWKHYIKTEQAAIQFAFAGNSGYNKLLAMPGLSSVMNHNIRKSLRLGGSFIELFIEFFIESGLH